MRLNLLLSALVLCLAVHPFPLLAADRVLDAAVAEQIIQRFVNLHKAKRPAGWVYEEKRLSEKLAADGRVLKSSHALYQWRVRDRERQSRLLELDGKRRDGSFAPETLSAHAENRSFDRVSEHYIFKIIKFEEMQGREVARIHFSPRKQQLRPRGKLEKILSRLEGDLWVILGDRELVKAFALLREPVAFGGGILGRVNRLEISYAQQRVAGRWVAESFEFEIDMRGLFRAVRMRELRRYSDFQEEEWEGGRNTPAAPVPSPER
ncbi:MAG: hypothetical protein HYX74_10380 [Acidobacteria bacterium]|nr:hypothetical protein [Acidobacteriota bacterium]